MKLVEVFIMPERLEAVKEKLAAVQVVRMTAEDVQGVSTQSVASGSMNEAAFDVRPMIRLEIAINEAFLPATLSALNEACGETRGKVFILPLEDVIRIRTGERGPEAV